MIVDGYHNLYLQAAKILIRVKPYPTDEVRSRVEGKTEFFYSMTDHFGVIIFSAQSELSYLTRLIEYDER